MTRFPLYIFVFAATAAAIVYFAAGPRTQFAQDAKPEPSTFEKFAEPDAVTNSIRESKNELVRVNVRNADDVNRLKKYGTVIDDFGSFIVLSKAKAVDMSRSGMDVTKIESTINLPGAKFEPLTDNGGNIVHPDNAAPEKGYYIIQFGGIVKDEWLQSLRDEGIEIIQYVPYQAFFAYGDGGSIAKAAGHSRVRWVGRYLPEYKVSDNTKEAARANIGKTATFDISIFGRADLNAASEEFSRVSTGRIISKDQLPNNYFNSLRVEMPVSEIGKIAALPDVLTVEPYERPQAEDERAAQIVAGNYSSTTVLSPPGYDPLNQFGVDGSNVTVSVSDDGVSIPGNGGFYVTANNTVHGPLRGAAAGATGGHGHINASIIAGDAPFGILDPLGYNYGKGVAPKANIINIPFLVSGNTTTDAQAVNDAIDTLGPNGRGATISNNSWGAGVNGNSYGTREALYDGLVRDGSFAASIDPFSIIFSAGNSGPAANSLTRPKTSKNTIAVANSENIRTEFSATGADNMDDLRNSSSRGPAADGRVKPDITAPGTVITGSRAGDCGSVTLCFDANHAYSSGTSHAAPQIAGVAALFTEYWRTANAGEEPRPSLIKAAIINTAVEMNGSGTTAARPNGSEGWGRVNVSSMLNAGVPIRYVNESVAFSEPGANTVITGVVSDPSKPVRVSLVWTDPPGVSDPALVNNLDLTVNVGGTEYRGNVFSNGHSTAGGSYSTVDNVENVFLPSGIPAGTNITITVNAFALNGDGILGNADATDQAFSLVAYNFTEPTIGSNPPVDLDGDGRTDTSIFRPDSGQWWYIQSGDSQTKSVSFGTAEDVLVPADFTGDGKDDITVWRPSSGTWYMLRSEDFTFHTTPFGTNGDVPINGDFDGDGLADNAVYRTSQSVWYILRSSGGTEVRPFGASGDLPIAADYDGDGTTDVAIYRPNSGGTAQWWIDKSSGGVTVYSFGLSTDKVVAGDYTGDGKADVAVWRPSTAFWYILRSEDQSFYGFPFGSPGDLPIPGDYDGDGKIDPGVFRPTSSVWYIVASTSGFSAFPFGTTGDRPIPNSFVR